MIPSPGTRLGGRYVLAEVIAAGGMGDVWRATDTVLGRTVAVKVLRVPAHEEGSFAARFRDEARHSAGLTHPNIAAVFDYGEDDGTAYLVMELVPGRPLSQLIADGPMPPEQVRMILGQCALALAAAHEAGVVHRDVKPANVLVTPEGQVKLTDFGIARAVDGAGHTRTGEVMGTPQYLAPEQALGRPVTGATDLYALGVVGHEMLTGVRPFDAGSPVATALAQVNDPPPPLPANVTDPLRAAVEACLAKNPAERPSSAASLAALLGMPVSGVAHASPATSIVPLTDIGPTQAMPAPTAVYGPVTVPVDSPIPGWPVEDDQPAFLAADTGRRRATWLWWLLPLVVALVAAYLVWAGLNGAKTPPVVNVTVTKTESATRTSASSTTSTAPTSTTPQVQLVESDYLGQTAGIVRSDLTRLGFTKVTTVQVASDKPIGTVVKVSPTGLLPVTTTITITVSSGPAATTPPPTSTGGTGG